MDLGRLHGIVPPLLTPLHEDGQIDHESLARLSLLSLSGH